MARHHQHNPPPSETVGNAERLTMFAGTEGVSAPSEGPFPLGPFPRHIWIHNNTPQDSLDKICHEIWKRIQQLPAELQPLGTGLHQDLPGTLLRATATSPSYSYWLDEPEGLKDIYRAMIGNREREMKLRALCDLQLSAKSVISNFLCSTKSHKNSKGLEDGSVTGAHGVEGGKLEVPFPLECTVSAKGAGNEAMAKEKVVKEFLQNNTFSSAKSSSTESTTATGQKQQLLPFTEICSKTDAKALTKNPVTTTATSDTKNIKNYASSSGFSTTPTTAAVHQPAWQNMSLPPFPAFPNHSSLPQFQAPYHPRARLLHHQAPHSPFGYYSRQEAPYNSQPFFQPPCTPMPNYIPPVQPGYLYQQTFPPALPRTIHNPALMAGDGIHHPLPPSYGFSSTPGGAAMTNSNYFYSESYVKF